MRIAVCEIQGPDRAAAGAQLSRYCGEKGLRCELRLFERGEDLVCAVEDGAWYDVVFLGISPAGASGLEAAWSLRRLRYGGAIVFLSAMAEYAVAGYDVWAAGYLLKPLCYDRLRACMDRVLPSLDPRTYQVCRRGQVVCIPYEDILYIESSNSKCLLHRLDGESRVIYKKLGDIEQELNDKRFLRCHQSYLVNMDHILRVDKQFELTTGATVLIRQHSLKRIRGIYLEYRASRLLCRPGVDG